MATKRTRSAKNKKVDVRGGSLGGFTIIEVVLVLAIAGLIFLMVFIALPQMQRAQRDTQRRQDMADLQAAVTQFQTNNNGKIPGQNGGDKAGSFPGPESLPASCSNDACRLVKTYMHAAGADENTFVDPDGTPYKLEIISPFTSYSEPVFDHTIYMYTQARCNGEEVVKGNNPRDYAIVYRLEGSGIYCQSSASGAGTSTTGTGGTGE